MLNGIIPGHAFKISRESDRIEGRLSRRSSTASITNQTLNRKGNCKNRKGHEEKLCRLTILKSELISVEKWEADLCAIQSKLERAEEEICNWRAKYENHEEDKEKLVEEMLSEIEKDYAREKERTRELNNENQQLTKDIDRLQGVKLRLIQAAMRLNFSLWRPNPES